jgi:hypothetical protein
LANVFTFLPTLFRHVSSQLKLHNDEEKGKRIFGKLAGKLVITQLFQEFEVS